ncbi:MAG: imidazoleglycerol-phosphate dehydratase HisB [Firmicutes bacterium]|nr:imidazoleglycerol-phosphate dehydratase HisB [Bacillota bacterium]
MRSAAIERNTFETQITMTLNIDGSGINDIFTGIGFFDHMLTHISKHGFIDLTVNADGDLDVDCHHTVEDVGIVLGKCFAQALGDKAGIRRYGHAIVPMDEALVLCAVDFSGRPLLVFDGGFTVPTLGSFDTEMVEEFFRAVSDNCGLNLHIKVLAGKNNHHIAEAMFKAFGRAVDMATQIDDRIDGVMSTKGMLE